MYTHINRNICACIYVYITYVCMYACTAHGRSQSPRTRGLPKIASRCRSMTQISGPPRTSSTTPATFPHGPAIMASELVPNKTIDRSRQLGRFFAPKPATAHDLTRTEKLCWRQLRPKRRLNVLLHAAALEVLDKPVKQAAVVVTKPWHEARYKK